MTDETSFTGAAATLFGSYYPKGYVVSVIHDRAGADRAVAALTAGGFAADDARIWTGQEVLDTHDRYAESHRVRHRLGRLLPSEEGDALEEYLDEAKAGLHFVTVRAADREEWTLAGVTLKEHGGHATRHYGDTEITDL